MTGTLHEDQYVFVTISRWILRTIKNILDGFVEKIKTHFLFNDFSRKSCRLWDNVEEYGTARQAADDKIARSMKDETVVQGH
jgi:hypothetical protein